MKTLGIIGGFGPQATADFYTSFIRACRNAGMSHQPHIIVWNVPVPQKFEEDLLLHGRGEKRFKPLLIHAAKKLENFGSDMIVLPCNTLQVFADDIQKSVNIPFINIIDSTLNELRTKHISSIGLLGTGSTIQSHLFTEQSGEIHFVHPNNNEQKHLDEGFHTKVVEGKSLLLQRAVKKSVQSFTRQGVRDILLASTDLHGELKLSSRLRVHDTLDILVRATVNML